LQRRNIKLCVGLLHGAFKLLMQGQNHTYTEVQRQTTQMQRGNSI
jgi:hypothetical protein